MVTLNINTSSYLYKLNNLNLSIKSENSRQENNLSNQHKSKADKLPVLTQDHIIYFTSFRSIRKLNTINHNKLEVATYGHIPNDLDSIVSSVALSYLYKKLGYNFKPYYNGESASADIKYVFNRFKKKHGDKIPENIKNVDRTKVLSAWVDHHDPEQSVDISIINMLKVIGIWDHHLLAKDEKLKVETGIWSHYLKPKTKKSMVKSGIHNYSLLSKTKKPEIKEEISTYSRIERIGATATIQTNMYEENGVKIPKNMAGLLLSAILSDTLNLISSTTTNKDKEAVEKLARIIWKNVPEYRLKKNIKNLAKGIFRAKNEGYKSMSIEELIRDDLKKYGGIFIGQIFPYPYTDVLKRKTDILKTMHYIEKKCNMKGLVFMVTDPIEGKTKIYFTDKMTEIVKKGYKLKKLEKANELDLKQNEVSRKDNVKPYLVGIS